MKLFISAAEKISIFTIEQKINSMVAKMVDRNDSRIILLDHTLFPVFDPFFARNLNRFFFLSLLIIILFGIQLFDLRISEGGDDSSYLLEALKFSKGESFPSFHGASYSILIGWLISLLGFHLILFKILSLIFLFGHQVFFFLTFRNRVSPFLLSSVLLICSFTSGILFFGSQTYTEAFYLMLQSVLFYLVLTKITNLGSNFQQIKTTWMLYIATGFVLFLLTTTRNIGLVALFAIVVYLLLEKKYWPALFSFAGFLIFRISYSLYKNLIWHVHESDAGAQLKILLQKDPYNSALGNETLSGILIRFFENTNIYLSRILMQEIGLKNYSNTSANIFITSLIIILLVWGFVLAIKDKQKYFRLVYIYLLLALGATFIALNQFWGQNRLIIPFIPLILLAISWLPAKISENKTIPLIRFFTLVLLLFVLLKNIQLTIEKSQVNKLIREKYRGGEKFAGYTPDYAHFLELSEWAAANVPKDLQIASRKASMSFIYGNGRMFYPINKIKYDDSDSVLIRAESTGHHLIIINDEELEQQKPEQVAFLRTYMNALISFENSVYSLYIVPLHEFKRVDSVLQPLQVTRFYSQEDFRKHVMHKENSTVAIMPDNMLDELWENNVHYLIDANLRIHQGEKTDLTINTITRYMTAINSKYKGTFTMVKQVGNNKDEPARLFRLNYSKCRQMGWVYKNAGINE